MGSSNNKRSLKKRKKEECAWAVMAIFKGIESISAAEPCWLWAWAHIPGQLLAAQCVAQ